MSDRDYSGIYSSPYEWAYRFVEVAGWHGQPIRTIRKNNLAIYFWDAYLTSACYFGLGSTSTSEGEGLGLKPKNISNRYISTARKCVSVQISPTSTSAHSFQRQTNTSALSVRRELKP